MPDTPMQALDAMRSALERRDLESLCELLSSAEAWMDLQILHELCTRLRSLKTTEFRKLESAGQLLLPFLIPRWGQVTKNPPLSEAVIRVLLHTEYGSNHKLKILLRHGDPRASEMAAYLLLQPLSPMILHPDRVGWQALEKIRPAFWRYLEQGRGTIAGTPPRGPVPWLQEDLRDPRHLSLLYGWTSPLALQGYALSSPDLHTVALLRQDNAIFSWWRRPDLPFYMLRWFENSKRTPLTRQEIEEHVATIVLKQDIPLPARLQLLRCAQELGYASPLLQAIMQTNT